MVTLGSWGEPLQVCIPLLRVCPGPSAHTQTGQQETETCQDTRPAKMTLLSNVSGMEEGQGFRAGIPGLTGLAEAAEEKENQET